MTLGPVMQASLAIAMLGAAALLLAGVRIVTRSRGSERRRGWLMIAVAAVLFGNVLSGRGPERRTIAATVRSARIMWERRQ